MLHGHLHSITNCNDGNLEGEFYTCIRPKGPLIFYRTGGGIEEELGRL